MIKKITRYFAIPLAICVISMTKSNTNSKNVDLSLYSTEGLELYYTVSEELAMSETNNELHSTGSKAQFSPSLGKAYLGFREAIAFKESRCDYFTVNTFGYLGKYQFGASTLEMIGIYNPKQFLYNPELQEKAFKANTERNKWILRKDIDRFVGKKIGGVLVTESGILAAAHLSGPGNVQKFLRSYGTSNFSDAFGSTVTYYMKKFGGYDTSFIKPNRRAKAVL